MKNKFFFIILICFILTSCVGVGSKGIFGTGVSVAFDPRSVGTQIDDSIMQKNLSTRIILLDKKYLISVRSKVLDGRIFLTGKVDNPEEKLKITKMAWETQGARSVRNDIKIKEEFNFKQSAKNMGDGWETRRRRGKGNDWLILNSIDGNSIDKIEISTHHFKGNYPSYCSLQAAYLPSKSSKQIVKSSNKWKYLLKNTKLSANKTHSFKNSLMKKNKINHIKINIFPDGGISRFRIYGKKI